VQTEVSSPRVIASRPESGTCETPDVTTINRVEDPRDVFAQPNGPKRKRAVCDREFLIMIEQGDPTMISVVLLAIPQSSGPATFERQYNLHLTGPVPCHKYLGSWTRRLEPGT